ncbi:MAG: phospholipid-binding protein MlaC [Cellvibrio sp.]
MKSFKVWAMMVSIIVSLLAAVQVSADKGEPQKIVEGVTQELFSEVKKLSAGEITEEAYKTRVNDILERVVNFPFIAANVMGQQAYSKATPEQRNAFATVFRNGLVNSYSKGISGYADSEIRVVSVTQDPRNAKRVTVAQEVNDKGTLHKLDYTMLQDKAGDWRVVNVTLNGVNLGMSFSSQFKSSMRKYGNDLDKVIAGWLADV